mmetsp:Transcript_35090/g.78101  ORF Transcript_35090/g.78101 Transcript_35090/m.78101 type:complete len:374 (-) Transcript_35090:714-1835(-)
MSCAHAVRVSKALEVCCEHEAGALTSLGSNGLLGSGRRCRLLHMGLLEQLVQHLGEGGVCVHVELDVLHGLVGGDGVGRLVDEVGGVQADDVHAQDLAGVLAVQHLGHAVTLLLGKSLGVGLEAGLCNAQLEALLLGHLLGLLLGHAHEGDLGVGEAGGGDRQVVQHVGAPAHVLHGGDTLCGGGVRQHVLAVGVTDAVHVWHHVTLCVQHLHLVRHGDEAAAVSLNVDGAQVQAVGVGGPAGSHQHRVHLQLVDHLLGLEVSQLNGDGLHTWHARSDLGGNDTGVVVNGPALDQQPLGSARNLLVKAGHQVVQGLNEGDLSAQGGVHVRELEADVAGANDGNPVGQPVQLEGVVRSEDSLAINGDAWGHERD